MKKEFNLSEKEYHIETCDETFEDCCVKQDDEHSRNLNELVGDDSK